MNLKKINSTIWRKKMQEEPKRRFYLREFRVISQAISTYEDLGVLTQHMAEGICRAFKVKGCSIMLFDERENQLFRVSSHGVSQEYLDKGPVFMDDKHCAFFRGETVFIEDMQTDPRIQYPEAAAKENIVSMLSIPIKCRESLCGVIRIYNNEQMNIHKEDLESISVLAIQLGVVIENNGLKNFFNEVKFALQSLPLRMLKGI